MFESLPADVAFVAARLLFGGTLAFMGLNHFMNTESMTQYAEFKGIPAPRLAVLGSGVLLLLAGLSLVTGVFAALGSALLAGFLLVTAVTMHDFWTMEGEDAQNEMTQFLKNVVAAGGALAFVVAATVPWPYALNVGF